MKKIMSDFGGVIFFYMVIVGIILMMNCRFKELNLETKASEVICIVEQ